MKLIDKIKFYLLRPFLKPVEFIAKRKKVISEPNLVFIVGVPRCGSTILYQELTNRGDFQYIDNYTAMMSNVSFVGASKLSGLFFRNRAHNSFKSSFGKTLESGLNAPSEAGIFWKKMRDGHQAFVQESIRNAFGNSNKPVVIKNLYTALEIESLLTLFPNSIFIHLKRNKEANCASIYKARRNFQIPKLDEWSVFPKHNNVFKSEEELVSYQYDSINHDIQAALKNTGAKNIQVNYEDYLVDRSGMIDSLIHQINLIFE